MSSTEVFLANNARYAEQFQQGEAPVRPAKQTVIITCMDARIETGRLLGLEESDAHVIRNAGGVVTDDVLRSLVISQRLLGTREIMLIHHTGCGMLSFRDDELKAEIEADTGLRPAFAFEAFPDLEEDVRQSMRRIMASPFVPVKDHIRGFVYDVETGRLHEVS